MKIPRAPVQLSPVPLCFVMAGNEGITDCSISADDLERITRDGAVGHMFGYEKK